MKTKHMNLNEALVMVTSLLDKLYPQKTDYITIVSNEKQKQ